MWLLATSPEGILASRNLILHPWSFSFMLLSRRRRNEQLKPDFSKNTL